MVEMKVPQTFKEWVTVAGIVGGLVPIVGGGWALSEKLHHADEAYAQVKDLKDDVQDLEQRYNKHIESAWKKYKVEEAEKERSMAKNRGASSPQLEVEDVPAGRETRQPD